MQPVQSFAQICTSTRMKLGFPWCVVGERPHFATGSWEVAGVP